VHDRNIARQQIGQLRQEKRRPQVAMSRSLRKAPGLADLALLLRTAPSTTVSRSPPPAATIMSVRASNSALPLRPAFSRASPAA
jgi:hypothetical protein